MRASAVFGSFMACVLTVEVVSVASDPVAYLGYVLFPLLAVFCALYAIRSRIVLTAETVTVQNAFKSYSVPLPEVTRVRGGYNGLEIGWAGHRTVVAGAVQKSNMSKWAGYQTRSDDIASDILYAKERLAARPAPEALDE